MSTPVIVKSTRTSNDFYSVWDENGTKYHVTQWDVFGPFYIYTDGSYSKSFGEISRDVLNSTLDK